MKPKTAASQTLVHHLHELRRRLLYCTGAVLLGATVGYVLREQIIIILRQPLNESLYYGSPLAGFNFVMQICLLVGIVCALPVIIYNLLRFIEPAFSRPFSRRLVGLSILASCALAVVGVAFGYFVSLPTALRFFTQVGTNQLKPLIMVDQYFRFVITYLLTFAVVFQLPLVLLLVDHITPLGPKSLGRWRRWVIVASFGVALVTPSAPDPLSQVILALPIIALYELSIWLVWLRHRRGQRLQTVVAAPVTEPASVQPAVSVHQPHHQVARSTPMDLHPAGRKSGPNHVLDLRPRG